MTDSGGNVVKSYTYKSFGEIYSESGTLVQPFTFTGREYDPESGLYYYRARYYDPRAGTFLTRDPIGFAGGDVNLYRYVQNNSVNWMDPLGLKFPGIKIEAGIFVALAGAGLIIAEAPLIGGVLIGAGAVLAIWGAIEEPRDAEEWAQKQLEPVQTEKKEVEKLLKNGGCSQ